MALPGTRPAVTPERWREVKDLFDRAMERPAGERAAIVDAARQRDPELAQETEQLIAANAAAGDFLEKPAVEQIALAPEPPRVPERRWTRPSPHSTAIGIQSSSLRQPSFAKASAPAPGRMPKDL